MTRKTKKTWKKLLIAATALVTAAAIGFGIWFGTRSSGEVIGVYPFEYIGMTEYWGDSQESYGPVTTDRIQTVYLSDTQTVTEVLVAEGDQVKKGDVLLRFDTTLSDLQLERKRLDVEKASLQLDAANAELRRLRNLKPMEVPDFDVSGGGETFLGETLTQPYKTYLIAGHDGRSMDTAFICWLQGSTYVDADLLETLRQLVFQDPGLCKHGNPLAACGICNCSHGGDGSDCEYCNLCPHGVIEAQCTVCNPVICQHKQVQALCPDCPCTHGRVRQYCPACTPTICYHSLIQELCPECTPRCAHGVFRGYCKYCCAHGMTLGLCPNCCAHGVPLAETCAHCTAGTGSQGIAYQGGGYYFQPLASTGNATPNSYYVIFKVTEGNRQLGAQTAWQGAHIQGMGNSFSINYFTPTTGDYSLPELDDTSVDMPSVDTGSGYTAAQLSQLRREQEKKVKDLEFTHRMAEAEYKIMQRELGDGNIYAEFDGKVVALLPEEEARDQKLPIVKLSGGGGFYIEGSVSELEKDNLKPGQEVTINDWHSGGSYTGTVKSIGDFPSQDSGFSGMGNPTATYYPFTVFVGEEADLQAGSYVSIQYATSGSTGGIYLDKAFLRTEQGQSYVYVLGADGCLEKRFVTTGKSLWGSYMEIRSGLQATDKLAFPYGKGVKPGAKAEERDIAELYRY